MSDGMSECFRGVPQREIHDKQIHRDEFRLRILTTDGCNQHCPWCLNDFQEKPPMGGPFSYLPVNVMGLASSAYASVAHGFGFIPKINISGGEPGIHPHIKELLREARTNSNCVMVNTNGTLMKQESLWKEIVERRLLTDIRVSVTQFDPLVVSYLKGITNKKVCYVFTKDDSFTHILDLCLKYSRYNIPLKLFIDFFGDDALTEAYDMTVDRLHRWAGPGWVQSRFTGRQENRGPGCKGCHNRCITLKAAWVFPDGTITPCPQYKETGVEYFNPKTWEEWHHAIVCSYFFHKVVE